MKVIRRSLASNLLAQNTLWMFLGQLGRVGVQAAYYVVIARALGPAGYGAFIGVVALARILAPFASWGSGNLLVQAVARRPELFPVYWGRALLVTVVSGALLITLASVVAHLFLGDALPLLLILTVSASDILFARLVDVSGQAFQAFQRLAETAKLQTLPSLLRLIGAVALGLFSDSATPVQWGGIYLASTAVCATIAIAWVHSRLGGATFAFGHLVHELRDGFYFSISLASQSIYNDIDKAMLTKLATLEAAGIYAASYRMIDVSFTPVRSILYAAYARFFQGGAAGILGSLAVAVRLLPLASIFGGVSAAILFVAAPMVSLVLGGAYYNAVDAIRWLSLIPLLRCVHYFAADTLTGAGYQGVRSMAQVAIGAVNVVLNMLLIPTYSWKGAALASLASDGLLAIALWAGVWWIARCERRGNLGRDYEGAYERAG